MIVIKINLKAILTIYYSYKSYKLDSISYNNQPSL